MTAGPLIEAIDVEKRYGSLVVLSGLSCRIEPGITGLLGANGSGKTTLLGMLLGLHPRDGGSLKVLGHDPSIEGVLIRERIGYAPEHHTLPPKIKAAEFVKHVAEIHGIPPKEATTRASDAMWLVELGEERFRPMGTMSTGQRQRVKLAQAIVHDPDLILLDEPTDGLDPAQRDVMLNLIRTIATDFGMNVIVSSHLVDEVERICDGAVVIGNGAVVASGSIDELRSTASPSVVVEVDGDERVVAEVEQDLTRQGFSVVSDRRLLTVGPASTTAAAPVDEAALTPLFDAVRDTLARFDAGLIRLDSRASSLEDVFIESMYGQDRVETVTDP